ncbi:hypothetical protein B0O99DRAFT_194755 [Bisporella sp. PMI_857]|nr:hypothetical protein B0O99DRAFT_194755 [Bisporella sp. PMI_857]
MVRSVLTVGNSIFSVPLVALGEKSTKNKCLQEDSHLLDRGKALKSLLYLPVLNLRCLLFISLCVVQITRYN